MLQCPLGQEILQRLDLSRPGGAPAQTGEHFAKMLGPGPLLPPALAGEHAGIDTEYIGQAVHGSRWRGSQVIRYEAEPGQGAQLHGRPRRLAWPRWSLTTQRRSSGSKEK